MCISIHIFHIYVLFVLYSMWIGLFVCIFLLFFDRYYSHASFLINVPFKKMLLDHHNQILTTEYVAKTVNRGGYFWSLGLRAFYFSFPMFLWIFGPIPMFLSCFLLVFMLYFLDVSFESGWVVAVFADDHYKDEEVGCESETA